MEKYSLAWQLDQAKDWLKDFKIESIEKTDSMMLIKARVKCPVYFTFYANYIVCSGDYGEWQFSTTWNTFVKGKPNYSLDFAYLLGKLSSHCKGLVFDDEACYHNLNKWKQELIEEYKEENKETWNKWDDGFLRNLDEYCNDVEFSNEYYYFKSCLELSDFLERNGYTDTWEWEFWDCGKIYDWYLICQLVMLKKIKEYFR